MPILSPVYHCCLFRLSILRRLLAIQQSDNTVRAHASVDGARQTGGNSDGATPGGARPPTQYRAEHCVQLHVEPRSQKRHCQRRNLNFLEVETATNKVVCKAETSNADYKIKAIDAAFGQSDITDIVFLVDRSNSINDQELTTIKETIRTLMDYLMLRRLLYLHKDYTRVAVLSFGVQTMVEFDGISSDSGTVHACNFDDKLGNIELETNGINPTNIDAALKKADEKFGSDSRGGANKVLWVFYDGEYDSGAVRQLKRQGVTVFSAGVGTWMNATREEVVISFADDKYHYACAKHWMQIINNVTPNENGNNDIGDNNRTLYVPDDTYTKGKCSSCPRLQRCVCNVLNRRYICAKYDVIPTHTTLGEVTPTNAAPRKDNLLLIIIIVGSATAVLLLLLVCCICCICYRRGRCTKQSAPSFPSRVPPRRPTVHQGAPPDDDNDDNNQNVVYYNASMAPPTVAPRVPPRSTAADGAPPDDKAVYYNASVTPPEVTPRLAPRRAGRPTVSGDIPSTRVAYFNASQFVTSRPDVVPPQDANDQAADDEGWTTVARSRETRQTGDLNMSADNGIGHDQDLLDRQVDPPGDADDDGSLKIYNVSDATN
ncbi:hypothetical protein LSAT2_027734 [Lamellibrachia satsuma]|nr:hypothetical protein LSAT2_027734 [Lamellibrachia satsuma]